MRLWDHESRKLMVCGITGSGKSTLSLQMLKAWKGQVFAFDHKPELDQKLGWEIATTIEEAEIQLAKRKPVVYWPGREWPGNHEQAFVFFCGWVYKQSLKMPGKKVLYVDEIWRFQSTTINGVPHSLAVILQDGRTAGLDMIMTAHCLNDVNRKVRAMCSEMYVFHQSDDEALKPIKGRGINPDSVKALKVPGEYIWANLLTGEQRFFSAKGAKAVNAPNDTRKADARPAVKNKGR